MTENRSSSIVEVPQKILRTAFFFSVCFFLIKNICLLSSRHKVFVPHHTNRLNNDENVLSISSYIMY